MTIVSRLDALAPPRRQEPSSSQVSQDGMRASQAAFHVEWRPLSAMPPLATEWKELAERALEPNVFYDPAFAIPAAPVFGQNVVAGLVWATGSPRLLGFFPTRVSRWRYGLPLPVLEGWTHPHAPLGVPLVDYDHAEGAIAAWFEELTRNRRSPALLMLPLIPEDGEFAATLDRATGNAHLRTARFGHHLRSQLAPGNDRRSYLASAADVKRRKELTRQRRRLQKSGAVIIETASFPTAAVEALDDLFALEATGWKSHAGLATGTQPDIRRFMEEAAAGLAANFQARVDRLLVGEHAVATMITLRSGAVCFGWKIAYDEAFARCSPGTQLLHDVTEMLLDDPTIVRADSCAPAGEHALGDLWRERLALSDRLILTRPSASLAFAIACGAETLRRKIVPHPSAARRRGAPR